jgi:two-component system, NarL family, nitrate/nitrite response regulator NarL
VFDESPLFRAGVAHVLNADSGLQVVAVSHTCQLGTVPPPDVVVLDAKMMMSEIGAARSAYAFRSWPKVLILALSLDEEQFLAAFAAGAKGYLLKGASERQLLEAVYAVHRGEGYVSPEVAATMFTRCGLKKCGRGLNASLTDQLSHREGEIFKLLPTGLTNREIGRRLGVTENTVKRYFTRIFEKLHVRNRVEAAMLSSREVKAKALQEGKPILGLAALVSILNFDAGDDVLVGGGGQDVVNGGPGDNVVIQSLTAPLDPFIM